MDIRIKMWKWELKCAKIEQNHRKYTKSAEDAQRIHNTIKMQEGSGKLQKNTTEVENALKIQKK